MTVTHTLKRTLALGLLAVSTSSFAEQQSFPSTLDYADVFNLEYAAAPQFSPNGEQLIYERRSMDIMRDRMHIALWQVNVNSGEHLPFIAGDDNVRQAIYSPDGGKVAFVSDRSGSSQIYLYYVKTGQQARISNLQHGPSNLSFSPDGKYIAFTQFTPVKGESLFTDMPAKPAGADWAPTARYINAVQYRSDGAGFLPDGHTQIYLLPVEGGTPRQLTQGQFSNGGHLSWSKDSSAIYFSANRDDNADMHPMSADIYSVDIRTTEVKPVTTLAGPESSPLVSPNGRYLAFTHVNDRKLAYQNDDILVMDLRSGEINNLTEDFPRAIGSMYWQNDSDSLVFAYDDQGETKLAEVELDGDIENYDIALGGQSLGRPYTSGQFALSNNGTVAFTQASTQKPADLALRSKRGKVTQVTHLNDDVLGHLTLGQVSHVAVKSSVDGRDIDAWMMLPPNFDANKQYPLILEIHGGPHAAYGPHFSMEIQLMAAKGYIVVWSNPRGSSSYGEDFGNLIHHNYPSQDYNDLMDAVDAVIAKGNVDKDNLFITGGSGGGVLTAWSVGKTDRFAAAVVAKPVINWVSFALTADAYPFFTQYWMEGKPWEIADKLWQRSPLSLVGNVTTPTLLLTGESDYRTPISESEQFYQALKLNGVDAAMVRLPGASHGIASRPSRLVQKVGNILAWFERYKTQPEHTK